jgi:hypothetical protein
MWGKRAGGGFHGQCRGHQKADKVIEKSACEGRRVRRVVEERYRCGNEEGEWESKVKRWNWKKNVWRKKWAMLDQQEAEVLRFRDGGLLHEGEEHASEQ